jgi:hypothetical protein
LTQVTNAFRSVIETSFRNPRIDCTSDSMPQALPATLFHTYAGIATRRNLL